MYSIISTIPNNYHFYQAGLRSLNHPTLTRQPPPSLLLHNNTTPKLHKFQISAIKANNSYLLFNHGSKMDDNTLKIAIVGFGKFGQFLGNKLVCQGHTILAYSRTDYSVVAAELGVDFHSNPDDLCEQQPEVIFMCTSILSTEKVLSSLPLSRLIHNPVFVDVLSVKEFLRNLFLKVLPVHFDIICTHPMFGPDSGENGWQNLPFIYEKVRIGRDGYRVSRCEKILEIFASEGCMMFEMTCAEHDRHASTSQLIAYTVGRILEKLDLGSNPVTTKGYERLLDLVKTTTNDSFDFYT